MIICFDCSAETKQKIDSLLEKDRYRDYSELISIAISNLWLLDKEMEGNGGLVIDKNQLTSTNTGTSIEQLQPVASKTSDTRKKEVVGSSQRVAKPSGNALGGRAPNIPDLFTQNGLKELSVPTLDISQENLESPDTFTLDRWLFGQYNKLLPVKANCRILARLIAEQPEGVLLDETAARIAETAALLGDYLADHDLQHQVARDEALATAFPRSGPEAEKSRARYANQFVGSIDTQGRLSGLLYDYRLAAFAPESPQHLFLTEPGMLLARLSNPVLDKNQAEPTQKFFEEEIAFLLEHISSYVPVENFAFHTLLSAIKSGANTPDKLQEALKPLVPTNSHRSLSPSFLTSQRSGALSRMADLGLIIRVRKGVRVSYIVTDRGQHFLKLDE